MLNMVNTICNVLLAIIFFVVLIFGVSVLTANSICNKFSIATGFHFSFSNGWECQLKYF